MKYPLHLDSFVEENALLFWSDTFSKPFPGLEKEVAQNLSKMFYQYVEFIFAPKF